MQRRIGRRDFLKLGGGAMAGSLVVLSLPGCGGGGSNGEVELRTAWWGGQKRTQGTNEALDLFVEQHPRFSIGRSPVGSASDYGDRITTQASGGNAPDILQTLPELTSNYADRNILLSLGQFTPDPLNTETIDRGVLDSGRREGELYEIPFGLATPALYYNTPVIQEAGLEVPSQTLSWEEYAAFAQEISDNTEDGVYGTENWGWANWIFEVFLRQQGKEFYTQNGQLAFEKEDLAQWFTYWEDLRNSGAAVTAEMTASENPMSTQAQRSITTGRAGIGIEYSNVLPEIESITGNRFEITMLPQRPEASGSGQHLRLGVSLSIYSQTEYPEESAQVINFLINDPEAAQALGVDRGVPASSTAREAVREVASETEKRVIDFIEEARDNTTPLPWPAPPAGEQIQGDLMPQTHEQIIFGEVTVDEGVDQFFSEAQSILEQG